MIICCYGLFLAMDTERSNSRGWMFVLLTGLSVSIGWGIRGQFGHEYGAALAGALGAMVVALLSGREDWHQRVHFLPFLAPLVSPSEEACHT